MKVFPAIIAAPNRHLKGGALALLQSAIDAGELPEDCCGVTVDGKPMFSGSLLFKLKDTHGFPLDFALDRIINDEKMAVDWPAFIEAARRAGWWDFQTYETLTHALVDSVIPKETQEAILTRFKIYVMQYQHPKMKDIGSA